MRECGEVIAVKDGVVDVRIDANETCRGCGRCFGAGQTMVLPDVRDDRHVRVGDRVEVEIPEETGRRAVWLVYVIPVIALIAGYLAGFLLGPGLGMDADTAGALGAVAFIGVLAAAFYRRARGLFSDARYAPRVHAIIARGLNGDESPAGPDETERVGGSTQ